MTSVCLGILRVRIVQWSVRIRNPDPAKNKYKELTWSTLVRTDVLGLLCKSKLFAELESLCHRGTTDFESRWSIDSLVWDRTLLFHLFEVLRDCLPKVG